MPFINPPGGSPGPAGASAAGSFPVLDGLVAPSIAYGLDQLLSSYNGPTVRGQSAAGNNQADVPLLADGRLDTVAMEKLAAGARWDVATLYDQSGNGRDATGASFASGNTPVGLCDANGKAYRIGVGELARPAMRIFDAITGQGLRVTGGAYLLNPAGKRFALYAVISQLTSDAPATAFSTGASVLIGNTWDGSGSILPPPGGSFGTVVTTLGYGGGRLPGFAGIGYRCYHEQSDFLDLTVGWPQDAPQCVMLRRVSDVLLEASRNSSFQESFAIANVSGTSSDCDLFTTKGTTYNADGFRCSRIVHWQVDPGAIESEIYNRTRSDILE